jgi:hypothetical protein
MNKKIDIYINKFEVLTIYDYMYYHFLIEKFVWRIGSSNCKPEYHNEWCT